MAPITDSIHRYYVASRRVRILAAHLAPLLPESGRVLDVGCGDGKRNLPHLAPGKTLLEETPGKFNVVAHAQPGKGPWTSSSEPAQPPVHS